MSHRIDTPNAKAAMPAPAVPGVAGYFGEVAPVTSLSGDWCNMVQEAIALTVLHVAALNKADVTQFAEYVKGAAAVKSGAAATGVGSTWHRAALLAAGGCSANAAQSAVVASVDDGVNAPTAGGPVSLVAASFGNCVANGSEAAIIASVGAAASPTFANASPCAIVGCTNAITTANRNVLIASKAVECIDPSTLAGGYSAAPIVATGANQNLTWKDKSVVGHRWGNEFHAGNVNTEVDTIRLNGTTGKAGIDGGVVLPNGGNQVSQTVIVGVTNIPADTTFVVGPWGNTSVVATSIILWSFQAPGGGQLAQGQAIPAAGTVTFNLRNTDPGGSPAYNAGFTISYVVINPA